MFSIKNKLGWVAIIFLSFLPLFFGYFIRPLNLRFENLTATLTSLGQMSGLVGMAMFALSLVLGSRHKFLEDYFGGMNRVYIAHHLLGSVGFLLMLFHPLLLAATYIQFSLKSAALFLLPSNYWPANFGIAALVLLTTLLVLTFYFRPSYQIWKFTHKFLGLAFFFASLHAFTAASDISRNLPLRIYMLALSALGFLALIYRTVFGKILVKRFEYVVQRVEEISKGIVEIEMSPMAKKMEFLAGQFIFVGFRQRGLSRETHPFSISSAPDEKNLKVIVKVLGDYTFNINNLKPGALAKVEGPFGRFIFQTSQYKNQVWIAGGIGITPFLSMAKCLKSGDFKVDLYYCVKSKNEAVFLEELLKIASQNPSFKVMLYCSDEQGFIGSEYIKKNSGGLEKKDIFLCGPPVMMKSLREQFLKFKASPRNIRPEEFSW